MRSEIHAKWAKGDERFLCVCGGGTNAFCASDERFSPGDERVENAGSNFSPTQLHPTSNFQAELLSRLLLRGTHSPLKTGGHYHVLTFEHTTPTSFIYAMHSLLE